VVVGGVATAYGLDQTEQARIDDVKQGNPCAKCGSKSILYVPGGLLEGQNSAAIGSFMPARFRIARYVCTDCGYTEEWVDRDEDMAVVRGLIEE
jgi:ribosomal protein S27AE